MNIRANLRYLRIVVRHKWYVLRFGFGTVPLWRLIVHDASKFSRAEWSAYRDRFASGRAGKEDKALDPTSFKDAWRHHWSSNPHHWEFWVNQVGHYQRGYEMAIIDGQAVIEMPVTFVHEMVADWRAASKAYSGKNDCTEWYLATRERQAMHPNTRALVEQLLAIRPAE